MNTMMLTPEAVTMSPVALFLQADLVVKGVMIALVLASVWTWAIIIGQWFRLASAGSKSETFEREFSKVEDVESFARSHEASKTPAAQIFQTGFAEWRASTRTKPIDKEATRSRLATVLASTIAGEIDRLSDRLNMLATIGAVAPFVGLFGTVWGIMRSFSSIAQAQNTSLAVVAPGIAEALFATALGLFAAIPAVIAYNRFSHRLDRLEARLGRFADGFHTTLSRELDRV
ncbi:MAG: protein TolQ [Sphingomonadaceae bacterium]